MSKILIVDDMKEVYERLQRKVGGADYSSSVDDALKKISEGEYIKVFTDYHLGEDSPKGGLEVLRETSRRGIESILMSTECHKDEALELGAKFIFKKELLKENGDR